MRILQLDEPEQPSFLRAYLFKVAANVATDLLRRRSTRLKGDSILGLEEAEPASQERSLLARQQLAIVEKALHELPPRCREAFRLMRQEGLASLEVASQLGVSDRMVRLYVTRALEHIESRLGETVGTRP